MKTADSTLAPGKTTEDFRRFSNSMLALADRGRMTLEILKDASFSLLDLFSCDAVEIATTEKSRAFHCDTREQGSPRFFCETIRNPETIKEFLPKSLRIARDVESVSRFFLQESGMDAPLTAVCRDSEASARFRTVVVIYLPVGDHIRGAVLLAYRNERKEEPWQAETFETLGRSLGLAFSHNQSQFELRERVKELTCMYGIAKEAVRGPRKIGESLRKIVSLLPPAWLYPEITEACIFLDGQRFCTDGYLDGGKKLSAEIEVDGVVRGCVEVAYRESRPELDDGPFLAEERHLIDSVAREVALILERRQALKEQDRLQEQLRHADRLATIGQLSAGVAHELNEPLTGILGFAELLQDLPDMPEAGKHDVKRIEAASLHAREVVRKLLLFARQVPTRRRPVDVNRVVRDVLSFFGGRLAKDAIRVNTDLAADLAPIVADEAQVRQVILNLVVNAVQAMSPGGTLEIRTANGEKNVLVVVQDDGMGMSPDVKKQVFLPFFSTKDVNLGTGLGLSVVHGIIQSHKGRIEVDSELGKGTTFTIVLPTEGTPDA